MRLALAFVVAAAVTAIAAPAASAQTTAPNPHPVTRDGPTGRFMLDGPWLLRVDRRDRGAGQHWEQRRSTAGWTPVTIPNAWNATDRSESGFIGAPAWYRKDFRLPSRARGLDWRPRVGPAHHRATVWLTGRLVDRHAVGFMPFTLPLAAVNRGGVNHLVVRVDNRRLPTDFPPTTYTHTNEPRGGWWNYGGIVPAGYPARGGPGAFRPGAAPPS